MNLTDQIAQMQSEAVAQESRLRDAEQKLEGERRRNDMQAGALRERAAEVTRLQEIFDREMGRMRELVERLSKEHGELVQLFRTVYGTSERLCKTEQSIAAHGPNPPQEAPMAPTTLRGKLSRLRAKAEAAA